MAQSENLSMRHILIPFVFASSIALNLFFIFRPALLYHHQYCYRRAEFVAAISCSGHGRAYFDALTYDSSNNVVNGKANIVPICECNACFGGSDCSQILPHCIADANRSAWRPSWSGRAAEEAELVAAISCSDHGRAYLDGLTYNTTSFDGKTIPICECNACFGGSDCSQILPACDADADSGDSYFLEPFWMQNSASSAILVSGWHRMSYDYGDKTTISKELENHIRKIHAFVGNAITKGRYIVFGVGSSQLLNAAIHSLSSENSSNPARVVASIPYYSLFKQQTDYFKTKNFQFEGEASLWSNNTSSVTKLIEIVTSPNNPDGQTKKSILQGQNVKAIYDRVYYWPHYSAISAPADEDIMLFSLSKLSGHSGTRFGWAVVKEKELYERMYNHVDLNTLGVSKDAQSRALQLIKVMLYHGNKENGLFGFAFKTLYKRWKKLNEALSFSKRFSLQKLESQYCSFFNKVRESSPAYAWVKCEREEEEDCYEVFKSVNIIGRRGSKFGAEERFVRLSLIKTQDDFDLLLQRLHKLVEEEQGKRLPM